MQVKTNKGLTLVALVITIIILLILSGIVLNLTIGKNGIITNAKEAKKAQEIAEIKERLSLEIATAESDAIIRNESLEKKQLEDIISKYGTLQEDGDTIITKEKQYEISLKEIWYGILSESGSYGDKVEQIEILEKEIADLQEKYKELEGINSGNSEVLEKLKNQITDLESQKSTLEEALRSEQEKLAIVENKLTEFKKGIATAISNQGINTSSDAELKEMTENIEKIVQVKTSDATAKPEDILAGKTAWVNGEKITGTRGKANTVTFSIATTAVPNASKGVTQYPLKDMDITNFQTLKITGSFSTEGSGYIELIVDNKVLKKISEDNNAINLEYQISSNSKLTIKVYGSYTRYTNSSLNVTLK